MEAIWRLKKGSSDRVFYLVFPISRTPEEPERFESPIKFELILEAISEATTLATYYRGVVVAEVFESAEAGHNVVQLFGNVSQELINAFAA